MLVPIAAVRGNARAWWQFAIRCVLETDIRRRKREWSWAHMCEHRRRCHRYARAYEARLTSRKPDKTTLDECEQLECDLDLFNLRLIRQRVDVQVDEAGALAEAEAPAPAATGGWFGGWFGGGSAKSASPSKSDSGGGGAVDISE